MNKEEAVRNFEKIHSIKEQIDMEKDINDCCYILSQNPINMFQVKQKIYAINEKHPENLIFYNLILYNLIYTPKEKTVQLNDASDANLIEDLKWKLNFLQAKKSGKTFDEFCKTMREIMQGN